MSLQKLTNWIQEVVNDPELGRCTALGLVHMTGGVEGEAVYSKQLPDKFTPAMVEDWADLFDKKMRDYAEGIPGAQTFCMLAFHNGAGKHTVKKPFVVAGYTEMDGLMTEAPTGKGLLQQMMRHVEGVLAKTNAKDQVLFEALSRAIESKTRETESLRQENIQSFGFIKDLVLQLAGKQHDQRLAEIQAQQAAMIQQEIAKWAPRLLNAATGREIIPQPTLDSQMVEDFIDALGRQGQGALPALAALNLPAPLLAQFADRFQRGMAAREREESTRKKVDEVSNGRDIDGLQ